MVYLGGALAGVLGAAGCDLNGLVDIGDGLLDPDAALLDRPGRKLVEGRYSGLKIAGSAEGGGYVLARRQDAGEDRVAVVPFLSGTACEYAPAFDYDRFSSRIDLELPGTLSIQVDQDATNPAFGTVRFIDYECREVIGEIPSTILPGPLFPGVDPTGMLARSSDGNLYLIDAEKRTRTVIAAGVDYGVVTESFLFTLESGEVVVRDDSLDVVDRLGEGAFGIVATGGSALPMAYEDATGVHAWSEEEGASSLAEDGCRLYYLGIDSVAYHQPCDTRRLAVRMARNTVFGEAEDDTLVTLRGPDGVIIDSLTMALGTSTGSHFEIAAVTQEAVGVPTGTLHALFLPGNRDPEAPELELEDLELADDTMFVPTSGLYYKDYADGRGTLLDFERDEDGPIVGVLELARDVAWVPYANPYSYRGVLADYDGRRGRLTRISQNADGSLTRKVIGEEVPNQAFVGDFETGLVAYVSELDDGGAGILTLVDELGPYEVADDVLVDQIRLLDDPHGVVFLRPSADDEAFELHAWLIEAELDLTIHGRASEYIPIPWPSPGVLYAVPDGDDAGLWFAKAR